MANPDSLFRILRISSRHRVRGTNSNFSVDFTDDQTTHRVREVHVLNCSLVHDFYNVKSFNNVLKVDTGVAGLLTLTITPGFYNITQLLAEIKSKFDTATGATITFTQSATTGIVSYTIVGETASFKAPVDDAESTLAPYLGVNVTNVLGANGTFDDMPNLIGVKHIFVNSPTINNGGSLLSAVGTFDNSFCSFPVNAPWKGLITYKSPATEYVDRIVYNTARDLSSIDIILRDDEGEILDLGGSHEFIMVLKIFYIP